MPEVRQSGIYRNDEGHAYWLRRGYIVSDEVAAAYKLDTGSELSDVQTAIVASEQGGPSLSEPIIAFKSFGTPGVDNNPVTPESIHTAPGSNDPVTARAVTTTGEEVAPEPVDVAPGGRRRKRPKGMQTPEDGQGAPETPEDGDEDAETPEDGDEGDDN